MICTYSEEKWYITYKYIENVRTEIHRINVHSLTFNLFLFLNLVAEWCGAHEDFQRISFCALHLDIDF